MILQLQQLHGTEGPIMCSCAVKKLLTHSLTVWLNGTAVSRVVQTGVCVCVYVCRGLKFLVRLCTDMNLKEAQEYANKLKKAEKMQKLREEVC